MNFAFIGNPLTTRIQLRKENCQFSRERHQRRPQHRSCPPRCLLPTDAPDPTETEAASFSSMAAGPSQKAPISGRLGSKKRRKTPELPKITPKTAEDFLAEGIVDDVDDAESMFEPADIRYGVGNVADPFREDENRSAAAELEKDAEQDEASRGAAGRRDRRRGRAEAAADGGDRLATRERRVGHRRVHGGVG